MITTEWPTVQNPHRVPFLVDQVAWLKSNGCSVDVFHFEGRKNPFNYLRAIFKVRKLLCQNSYNLIHAQWGQSAVPVWGVKLPLIITYRGSDLQGIANRKGHYTFKGKILQLLSRIMAYQASRIIVVSDNLKSKLPTSILHKVKVIPTGLDFSLFKPLDREVCRKELGLRAGVDYVLFGGDPARTVKRFFLAQQAIALLPGNLKVELLVVKNVDRVRMPLYFGACRVLLLTSLHEGSPNVVKEALACNRPVVSVDVGDVRERVTGIAGCAVAGATPQALADALVSALLVKEIDSRNVVQDLDEDKLNNELLIMYRRLI